MVEKLKAYLENPKTLEDKIPEEYEDISKTSHIISNSAGLFGKLYVALYALNVATNIFAEQGISPEIIDDISIDNFIIMAGVPTTFYSFLAYLSKSKKKIKDYMIKIKRAASKYKFTDLLINNKRVNDAFSTFAISHLGLTATGEIMGATANENLVPIFHGNAWNETPKYDYLHFSIGAGIGGYFSKLKDKFSKKLLYSLSAGLIFSSFWESFEYLGEKIFGLFTPGMTSDTPQDFGNVEWGAGLSSMLHYVRDKIKGLKKRSKS